MQEKLLGTHVQKSLCRRIHLLPHFEPSLYNGIIFSFHAVFIVQQDAKQNLSLSTCEIILVIRSEKQRWARHSTAHEPTCFRLYDAKVASGSFDLITCPELWYRLIIWQRLHPPMDCTWTIPENKTSIQQSANISKICLQASLGATNQVANSFRVILLAKLALGHNHLPRQTTKCLKGYFF